jgi:DNA invertase Pin-like site-specific DNA recombinase
MSVYGYTRVSTAEQGQSGLSLRAQAGAIEQEAARRGWTLKDLYTEVASGSGLQRPQLNVLLDSMRSGDALVVAKLDRLSRSVVDAAQIMERARREGWALIALDLGVDTSTPAGELVANVMSSVAQWERRVIGERTSAALMSKPRGQRGGGPVYADSTIARARELRESGHRSYRAIALQLEAEGHRPPRGKRIHSSAVRTMVAMSAPCF